MDKEYYGSGEVAEKLGIPRRTITDQAARGRLPQILLVGGESSERVHRRYPRKVIDQMAEGYWPPVELSLKDRVFEVKFKGLASEPLRITPCPGELPEVTAPEMHLPGGPTLPAWHLDRVASPFEVAERLRQHFFCS